MPTITAMHYFQTVKTITDRMEKGKLSNSYKVGKALNEARTNLNKEGLKEFEALCSTLHTVKKSTLDKFRKTFRALEPHVFQCKEILSEMEEKKVSYTVIETLTALNAKAFNEIMEGRETYLYRSEPLTAKDAENVVFLIQKEGKTTAEAFSILSTFSLYMEEKAKAEAERAKQAEAEPTEQAETVTEAPNRAEYILFSILGEGYVMEGKTDEDIVSDILKALTETTVPDTETVTA